MIGLFICFIAFANIFCAGTTELNFLRIPVGQRATALAQAYTALSDEVNGIYFNPAGLANLQHRELSFGYISWVNWTNGYHLTYGNRNKYGDFYFAISAFYLATSPIDKVGIKQPVPDIFEPKPMGETINVDNYLFTFSLSKKFGPPTVCAGVNIKYAQSIIDKYNYGAIMFDLGTIYTYQKLYLGFVIKNLGSSPKPKFSENKTSLPAELKFGLAYRASNKLLISADLSKPITPAENIPVIPSIGLEYTLKSLLARIGYRSFPGHVNRSGISVGFGLNRGNFAIDYAFTPFSKLGSVHQFSISLRFIPR